MALSVGAISKGTEDLSCFAGYTWTLLSCPHICPTISPTKALLKMMFLFPRWDMLVPWRVGLKKDHKKIKSYSGSILVEEPALLLSDRRVRGWSRRGLKPTMPSLKLTACPRKLVVRKLLSFWEGPFWRALLVSGTIFLDKWLDLQGFRNGV